MTPAPGKFFWKLFLSNVFLLVAVVGACVWLLLVQIHRFYDEETEEQLRTLAEVLRYEIAQSFENRDEAKLDTLAKDLARESDSGIRITFVLADGTVLGDSEAEPAEMENHADRPEIREAMRSEKGWGEHRRVSATVDRDMKYTAVRVGTEANPLGVVRVSKGAGSIADRTDALQQLLFTTGLAVLAAAVILALLLARIWSGPIARMTAAARSISKGDLSARVKVTGSDEVAMLARSLNRMRNNLARQLETIDRHNRTLESLLAQIHEGVVVAGPDGRILLLNPAAKRLLGIAEGSGGGSNRPYQGPVVETYIPQAELRRLLTPTENGPASSTGERDEELFSTAGPIDEQRLTLERAGRRVTVLARASDIVLPGSPAGVPREDRSAAGGDQVQNVTGRLLVLTDITELTRTIQIKADFVANASHELRTPLSAIRAATETLMSVDPANEAGALPSLLSVIERHSARLEAMVADLLDLSRLESPDAKFHTSTVNMVQFLDDLRERFGERLVEKRVHWEQHVDEGCASIVVSRHLLTLVLDNLIDNAIKFTERAGHVWVRCVHRDGSVEITVEDDGCGIPEDETDRIFERFYQVERSRSGQTRRGTGLGLAIVRHAVNGMSGQVQLTTQLGAGTRITVTIPQREQGTATPESSRASHEQLA